MKLKKFHNFTLIKESNVIEDPHELLNICERYLIENTVTLEKWKKNFFEVMEDDVSYRSTAYQLDSVLQKIESEKNVIKKYIDNSKIFIDKIDDEYKEDIDDENEEVNNLYYELSDIYMNMEDRLSLIDDFKSEVREIYDHLIELDETITSIRHFKFD